MQLLTNTVQPLNNLALTPTLLQMHIVRLELEVLADSMDLVQLLVVEVLQEMGMNYLSNSLGLLEAV